MSYSRDTLMSKAIQYLQQEVHQNAIDHGWWTTERNKGEMVALIHSEASELLESLRTPEMLPSEHVPEISAAAEELADIVIRCADMAESMNIDLGQAISLKHQYNVQRPMKHGGKKF